MLRSQSRPPLGLKILLVLLLNPNLPLLRNYDKMPRKTQEQLLPPPRPPPTPPPTVAAGVVKGEEMVEERAVARAVARAAARAATTAAETAVVARDALVMAVRLAPWAAPPSAAPVEPMHGSHGFKINHVMMLAAASELALRYAHLQPPPTLEDAKGLAVKGVAAAKGLALKGLAAAKGLAATALTRSRPALGPAVRAAKGGWRRFGQDEAAAGSYAPRVAEVGPPPLVPLLIALAAGSIARGLLLPFHILISSELEGRRTLLSRGASSLLLVLVAARAASAMPALRAALSAAAVGGLIGVGGGLSDRVGTLILSAVVSTFAYAAQPLAQALATAGNLTVEETAARLGALAATNGLGASAGVHICLSLLGATSGTGPTAYVVLLCGGAALIALVGVAVLPPTPPPPPPAPLPSARAPSARARWRRTLQAMMTEAGAHSGGAGAARAQLVRAQPTTRAQGWAVFLTFIVSSVSMAVGAVLVQRHADGLTVVPTDGDRLLDATLRLLLQAFAARRLARRYGGRGLGRLGFLAIATGTLLAAQPQVSKEGIRFGPALGPAAQGVSGPSVAVQLLAHHLMRSGLLLAETGVATLLVARSAACSVPVVWRVSSLVALHLVVTLGPTLLPLLGGADGSWAPWLVASLAPLPLLSLVPPV